MLTDSLHDHIDLLIGEHSTGAFGKCRHGSSVPVRGYASQNRIIRDGEIYRIIESHRCSAFSVVAVAAGAVLSIQQAEIHILIRIDMDGVRFGPTGCV
jgi:hypothetical protein